MKNYSMKQRIQLLINISDNKQFLLCHVRAAVLFVDEEGSAR